MALAIHSSAFGPCESISTCVKERLSGVPADKVCGVVFCGTNEVEYHLLLDEIKSAVYASLGTRVPVTLIPQYLLPNGGFSIEIYTIDSAEIEIKEHNGICYGVIESDKESLLFIEGIPSSDFSESVRRQSDEVFGKLDELLTMYGFEVDDIVRQWNYIGNIVACRGGKQNYQEFNDARSAYYGKCDWSNGYPAATGIGGSFEGIVVGGIAFKRAEQRGVFPIDNPLQVAAHVYSKSVLIDEDANAVKSTPKFERAKLIESANGACCFVSGTAAIRGEESMDASSARLQTIKTIENIEYLVSKENLVRFGCKPYELKCVQLQVFIKYREDYEAVREEVEKVYPHLTVVYSLADVCRSELLVEIEGILIS